MSERQWHVYPLQRSLGEHGDAWDSLRRRLFSPNPVLGSVFVNALLQHFGTGNEQLGVLHQNGKSQAMCILQPGGPLLWRSFLPAQAPIGPAVLDKPDDIRGLIRALPGHVVELDLLCNDPDFGDLPNRTFTETHSINHKLTMHIDLTGSFADYWARRPKKVMQNMARYHRRMDADGLCPRFVAITAAADMPAAVARYAALEAEGWKGDCGTAIGSANGQQAFYEEVMRRHAVHGTAVAWELWFGDRLTASRLAIFEDQTLVMLKTTYLEGDSAYAPGRELLRLAIEHSFTFAPGGRIEFYTDASADQLQWATGHRWIRHLAFYRHAAARMGAAALRFFPGRAGRADPQATADNIQISVYRHPAEFPAPVVRFFKEAESISMQFGVDWYRNLIDQVFSDHPGVKFYVMAQHGKPVAAVPLLATRTRFGWRVQSLANYYTALYAPLLDTGLKSQDLAQLFKAVLKDHPGLSAIQLSPMATDAPSFRTLKQALNLSGLACFPYFCFGNWFLPVREDWAAYLKGRKGQQRNTIARMGKKFASDGGRLEVIDNAGVERGLDAYRQVYAASWKQPEPYQEFMPGLIRLCAARGWLRLGVAWLADKPIAAQIWIVANGKADIYKLAYDEAYKAYSPGTLLTAVLMRQALDLDRVSEVDYLIGDDPYKEAWVSTRRERWGLVAYSPFSALGLAGLARELSVRLVKFVAARYKPAKIALDVPVR